MPYIDSLSEHPDLPMFYNVTYAVGSAGYNVIEDVELVQFFLQQIYRNPAKAGLPPSPKGAMKVDGSCGPVTRNWIVKYQLDVANKGKLI
ncbi:MAG: hypothetical protein ACRDTR_12515, partial [Rubrobacter sp.]